MLSCNLAERVCLLIDKEQGMLYKMKKCFLFKVCKWAYNENCVLSGSYLIGQFFKLIKTHSYSCLFVF